MNGDVWKKSGIDFNGTSGNIQSKCSGFWKASIDVDQIFER
jgi:hypothetical protein